MRKIYLLLTAFTLLVLSANAQKSHKKEKFRIVGYYALRSAMNADLKTVPFDQMTHINLSFLNPDTSGNFTQDYSKLAPFIKAAHEKHVKVLASIAGGGKHAYYAKLLNDKNRARFINDLLLVTLKYDLDGIDVDIEGSDIDANYENFATGLARVMHANKKLTTSAIAVFYKDQLSDKAMAQYDFVNIMSYDHTGPWAPAKPGPHSTYQHAVEDVSYFGVDRKIPKEKLVLGVGFYGYGFGPALTSTATSMTYGQILNKFPGSQNLDQVDMPGGAIMYYNGIPTMKKKTDLAKKKASGIMIWQIQGDSPGENSLLAAINEEAYGKKLKPKKK